jgi:hypothetical protein
LKIKRHRHDYGLAITQRFKRCVVGSRNKVFAYELIEPQHDDHHDLTAVEEENTELPPYSEQPDQEQQTSRRVEPGSSKMLQFYRTFSKRSKYILLTHVLIALHNMAFDALFPLLMHLSSEGTGGGGGFGMGMSCSAIFDKSPKTNGKNKNQEQ